MGMFIFSLNVWTKPSNPIELQIKVKVPSFGHYSDTSVGLKIIKLILCEEFIPEIMERHARSAVWFLIFFSGWMRTHT